MPPVESNEFFSHLSYTNNYWTTSSVVACVGCKNKKVEIDKAVETASGEEQFLHRGCFVWGSVFVSHLSERRRTKARF